MTKIFYIIIIMKQWLWIGKDGNYFLDKTKKKGWIVFNRQDNNLYYSMGYNTPVEKVKKWTLALNQSSLKKELIRVYNDPWDMESTCGESCKRVKILINKNKKNGNSSVGKKKRRWKTRVGKKFRI